MSLSKIINFVVVAAILLSNGSIVTSQDSKPEIYLIVDTSASLGRQMFCGMEFAIQNLIAGIVNEVNSISALKYPAMPKLDVGPLLTIDPPETKREVCMNVTITPNVVGNSLLDDLFIYKHLKTCKEAVESHHNVSVDFLRDGDKFNIRSTGSYPAWPLNATYNEIKLISQMVSSSNRRTAVVIFADGDDDWQLPDGTKQITSLLNGTAELFAVYLSSGISSSLYDPMREAKVKKQLTGLVGGSASRVIISDHIYHLISRITSALVETQFITSETGSKMMARLGDMEDVERKLSKYCSCTLARSTLRRFDPRFNNNISLERLCLPHCLQLEPLLSPDIPLRDRNIDMIRAAVRECSNPTVCS